MSIMWFWLSEYISSESGLRDPVYFEGVEFMLGHLGFGRDAKETT